MPSSDVDPLAFDLFISYAHADDRGEDHRKVSALVEAIQADYLRVAGVPLRVFFDVGEIRTMDDWESRILLGLRQSKMMVAVLSPAYFRSDYCRKEWEAYVETELAHALPGDGIASIYVVKHPDFEAESVEDRLRHWVRDLKRRQYIDWIDFWPEGASALEREDVRRRLDVLPRQIADRLRRAEVRERSPHTVPMPSVHFVGRRDEMHRLRLGLLDGHIGAITAVHGIPGIGKSMLAFAYAWGYGFEYPGGRFLINAANLSDLAAGMIALAEPKGVPLGDEERKQPDLALAKVKKALEDGPPALIVIDNLDDPAPLSLQSRERCLPRCNHVHVLATTRVSPEDLPRIHCLPLDALDPPDALALLHDFRPIPDSPQDVEWKAALEIVNRLGGHALAVEVAAVYLRENPGVSYREFASTLEREGVSLMEEEVGPQVLPDRKWHAESCVARLLEPTLQALSTVELRAVECAAFMPPDKVPFRWIHSMLLVDFPKLAESRIGDKVATIFKRLERLRLVVPLERHHDVTSSVSTPEVPRLARMHRLVQDVIRLKPRLGKEGFREEMVYMFAILRAWWIRDNWGEPGLAWELPPLLDMALRLIDQGDRRGPHLGDCISDSLIHTGRLLQVDMLWRRSASLNKRLHEADPDNAAFARELAVTYEKLADLEMMSQGPLTARVYYEDALAIRRRLSDASPENADYARDLSVSYNKLGNLAVATGNTAGARRYFEDGLAIARRLSEASPENADYAHDLSVSYNKLGDLARNAGDLDVARDCYKDCKEIALRLLEESPDNAKNLHILAMCCERLGHLSLAYHENDLARAYFEHELGITRLLLKMSPENADYAHSLSISYYNLGEFAIASGEGANARKYFDGGLAIQERLYEVSPEIANYARSLWLSCWKIANLLEASGDEDATAWWRRAWEILAGMKARELHISPEDERFLKNLEDRFRFDR